MIKNRIQKNLKSRSSFLKQENTNCFRLYEMDIPEYPFIVDIYNNHAVIWPKFNPKIDLDPDSKLDEMKNALMEVFGIEESKIYIKERVKQKGSEQYEKKGREQKTITVEENGLFYLINLSDYLDCGLFMDHRPFRKQLKKMDGQNKKLLNLFSYTCSISVAGAKAGFQTTSVDLSNTYLSWGKENFHLNNLNPNEHHFVKKSALEYLEEDNIELFDLIFLDPPTFSNSKSMEDVFEVEKDHVLLIDQAIDKLNAGGVLYFSNNKTSFKLDPKIKEKYSIKNITDKSIPYDFRNKKIHHFFEIKKDQ